ncbi:MAG TPA: branched-chain amino acid ABC transporter permease [Firmicutes bacterium]|nr:branched-chain amino acid ABC transporter permease [Bacillota bacterium]
MRLGNFLRKNALAVIALVLVIFPLTSPPDYQFYIVERSLQNAILAIGLVILLGYTGPLSLGHAGLLATGAYTYGILATKAHWPLWLAFLAAPVVAGVIGLALGFPSLRLKGPFLMVVTIAFGEIVRIVALNEEELTGGPYGLQGIPRLINNDLGVYYLMVAATMLVAIATLRLHRSRIGLALLSIKEDPLVTGVMGVDVSNYKVMAFVLSAALAGLSGAFFAMLTRYLNPDSFTILDSATYLLMVVLGGMDSVVGAILASGVVTALPEILRFMERARLLVYAIILLLVIWGPSTGVYKKLEDRFGRKSVVAPGVKLVDRG